MFIWTKWVSLKKTIKGKAKRAWNHLTPSIVHMALNMCICLCSLISSPINIKYKLRSFETMGSNRLQSPYRRSSHVYYLIITFAKWYKRGSSHLPCWISSHRAHILGTLILNGAPQNLVGQLNNVIVGDSVWHTMCWHGKKNSNLALPRNNAQQIFTYSCHKICHQLDLWSLNLCMNKTQWDWMRALLSMIEMAILNVDYASCCRQFFSCMHNILFVEIIHLEWLFDQIASNGMFHLGFRHIFPFFTSVLFFFMIFRSWWHKYMLLCALLLFSKSTVNVYLNPKTLWNGLIAWNLWSSSNHVNQCPGFFLDPISPNLTVSMFNWSHVVILWILFVNLRYIP